MTRTILPGKIHDIPHGHRRSCRHDERHQPLPTEQHHLEVAGKTSHCPGYIVIGDSVYFDVPILLRRIVSSPPTYCESAT